jgi:Arc/MetJ family transcription regulator
LAPLYNHCINSSLHHCITDRVTTGSDMRTTLDIDDDLLAAAKELARRERSTAGQVVSRLLRHSLTGAAAAPKAVARTRRAVVAGFQPFPARPGVVATNQQVDALRDAEGL